MYQPRRRNATTLWVLIMLAALYAAVLVYMHTLTGQPKIDGAIGVVLGLFICSRGASNLIDLVLFGRVGGREPLSGGPLAYWLALNAVVIVAGYLVIAGGATRFAQP